MSSGHGIVLSFTATALSMGRCVISTASFVFIIFCNSSFASPWLEADDPFLRSSLVLLSDSNQISSPVNIYPIRWSMFGDDLNANQSISEPLMVMTAKREIVYSLNSAKLNRENRLFKTIYNEDSLPTSFGEFNENESGVYTSVDYLSNNYSFRLTSGYTEEDEFDWSDSYLSLNAGAWLFNLGDIDRWWGQGWQHNLILASYAKAAPDISVSYIGISPFLGNWSFESLLSSLENDDVEDFSATRLISRPLSFFEYGVTFLTWFANGDSGTKDQQLALDAKYVLPSLSNLYHNVYFEAASTSSTSELGAWVFGWTGSFNIANHTARIVLESQQTSDAHDTTEWNLGAYPSITDDVSNTSYLLDKSQSIALYLQFSNDQSLGIVYRRSEEDSETTTSNQLSYRFPALSGMGHLGASVNRIVDNDSIDNDTNVWAGYEFRF